MLCINRRKFLAFLTLGPGLDLCGWGFGRQSYSYGREEKAFSDGAVLKQVVDRGLAWLASRQGSRGGWELPEGYPTALSSLAGMAFLCDGSTPLDGRYSQQVRSVADFLLTRVQKNGLIGVPSEDDRYTYGHGFAMLFLSQILGEEGDLSRRRRITEVLTRAVAFTGSSQTRYGGWGYVSEAEGGNFDEGSTTITQVQALRGCRMAGIDVPKSIIDRAVIYIHRCSIRSGAGGIQYNIYGGSDRPPISAAALASLYNAGEYDGDYVPKLSAYCKNKLGKPEDEGGTTGFWHYAHYYYSQVVYREGSKAWCEYRDRLYAKLLREVTPEGCWKQGYLGAHLTTSMNLTMLQLEKATLPIYQR